MALQEEFEQSKDNFVEWIWDGLIRHYHIMCHAATNNRNNMEQHGTKVPVGLLDNISSFLILASASFMIED